MGISLCSIHAGDGHVERFPDGIKTLKETNSFVLIFTFYGGGGDE
jgi:hypothetical protein